MRAHVVTLVLLALAACSDSGTSGKSLAPGAPPAAPPGDAAGAAKPAAGDGETLATVGTINVSRADVEGSVQSDLAELEARRYEILRGGLNEMIARALIEQEAQTRGVSLAELQTIEVFSKVEPPSDAEVQAYYDQNRDQFFGRPLEAVKEQISHYLQREATRARIQSLLAELKKKYPTKILLRPPTVEVDVGGAPAKGPTDAPVTIIEFGDYDSPFSKNAELNLQGVLKRYGDKVRFGYRNYPVPDSAGAAAAEAALCANAQGKFWPYHEKLMAAKDVSATNLRELAAESGLDRAQFDECLTQQKYREAVQQDIAAAQAAGVEEPPVFFINGRRLTGVQPFESFAEVIEQELEHAGQG
jgi:protein-disulfide isomerase